MGLARIAIAVLAVALALGLVIVGGVSLYGALTKDASNSATSTPATSPSDSASSTLTSKSTGLPPSAQSGNTIEVQCLATQCPLYVAGPGATDVVFNGDLLLNERKRFTGVRLVMQVDDASTVSVTINGRRMQRGHHGQQRTYRVPARQ